jgi:hypothetical protein
MPGQISDGPEPGDEQEESNLGGLAGDNTREKILDLFQNYLSAREHGSRGVVAGETAGRYAIDERRNQGVISSPVLVCG